VRFTNWSFVNVRWCENISPGLYHYCPKEHRLEKICDMTEAVDALLEDAARSAGLAEATQILITIAARFQRLSWKYESMAYSVTRRTCSCKTNENVSSGT
jgi:oxazoline/thiazoline dehydrogenase